MLPVVLLLAAILELAAVVPAPMAGSGTGDAALLGPGAFVPVSLAVVWAALLAPSRPAGYVKALTAAGATGFVVARLALAISWWTGRAGVAEPGWTAVVLGLSGLLLGVALMVWSIVDVAATRYALAQPRVSPLPEVARVDAPPARSAVQPMWQSVSTPWPRRDETDPDGTLIRPPQSQRQQRRRS